MMDDKINILAVDDVEMNQSMLEFMLADVTRTFLKAGDGKQALDLLDRNPDIDIILLDLEMPVMDGFETLSRLKQSERFREIPVIVITSGKSEILRTLAMGANDFLSKPYNLEELKLRVMNHARSKKLYDMTRDINAFLDAEVTRKTSALEASEKNTRSIIENAPFAIVVARVSDGKILVANRYVAELFGMAHERATDIPMMEYFDDRDFRKMIFTRLVEKGSVTGIEANPRKASGERICVLLSAGLSRFQGENVIITSFSDITERKRAEQALLESDKALRQLQKMEAMGTLASGIAHDFNNILGVMLGFTELAMLDAGKLSNVRSKLEKVHKAGERAQDLVRQILTFSRQTDQEMKPVDVSPLIKEAIKMLRATIPRTIQIRHFIRPRTCPVMADPTQIHQVVMNLVTNAAHAVQDVDTGTIEITLDEETMDPSEAATHPDLKPGHYVVLRAKDNGCGIPPSIIEKIFDPFFTTKETGKGTGMGLAVVHGIVKSHGGVITVESRVGAGSTFTVRLPAVEKATVRPEDETGILARGTGRVLFVDDEDGLAVIGQSMLQRLGYQAESWTSSLDALDAFRADPHKYDLVITDYSMPGMTGMVLSEEILKIRPDIPIILCTGYSDAASPEKVKAAGIRVLLMKPVLLKRLALTVNGVLTGHTARTGGTVSPDAERSKAAAQTTVSVRDER